MLAVKPNQTLPNHAYVAFYYWVVEEKHAWGHPRHAQNTQPERMSLANSILHIQNWLHACIYSIIVDKAAPVSKLLLRGLHKGRMPQGPSQPPVINSG